jgi:predicted nucleic acid-binding protein
MLRYLLDANICIYVIKQRPQHRLGRPIGVNDLHIAAHARSEGHTLVSNNLREFERVQGLLLENWA